MLWTTPLGLSWQCGICMHQHSTSGIRRKRRWYSTYWQMTQCKDVGWLLWWFALMIKICDIEERNLTIRSEIWTTNLHSLRFRNIREWVTLWRLILRSLECITKPQSDLFHGHLIRHIGFKTSTSTSLTSNSGNFIILHSLINRYLKSRYHYISSHLCPHFSRMGPPEYNCRIATLITYKNLLPLFGLWQPWFIQVDYRFAYWQN